VPPWFCWLGTISGPASTLALSGNRPAAEDILARLLDQSTKKYVSPYNIAVTYSGLGRTGEALAWLNKAYDEHAGFMVYVYLDPRFKQLRRDPRFRDLLYRMGFQNQSA
jgi:hypothetical protein